VIGHKVVVVTHSLQLSLPNFHRLNPNLDISIKSVCGRLVCWYFVTSQSIDLIAGSSLTTLLGNTKAEVKINDLSNLSNQTDTYYMASDVLRYDDQQVRTVAYPGTLSLESLCWLHYCHVPER